MRSLPALVVGVVLGLVVSVAPSCGPMARPCGPATCQGCCDEVGECLAGTAVFECGAGGMTCQACAPNELCSEGACTRFMGGDYDASFPFGLDASINFDAGLFDAGTLPPDSGADGGLPDSGMSDAGRPDSGVADAGRPDAGLIDGGRPDSGVPDAGRPDAGATDAGAMDAGPPDAGPPVSFMTDLVPILGAACTTCHANRATYSDVRARVVPFNPPGSLLFQKITGTQASGGPMPPGAQLSVADPAATELIERWILQGALNN